MFNIGDKIEVVQAIGAMQCSCVGMRGTVASTEQYAPDQGGEWNGRWSTAHLIDFGHMQKWLAVVYLRKLDERDDSRDIVRWADCPWQPETNTAP